MSLSVGEFRDAQELKAFNIRGLEISAWGWIEGSRDRNANWDIRRNLAADNGSENYIAITAHMSICASGSRGSRLLNYSTVGLHR